MRILVTGSRDWEDENAIYVALDDAIYMSDAMTNWEVTVVSGACPTGADTIAERIAKEADCQVERHPAEWDKYGKGAGFRRNAEMVKLGADLCLAFIKNDSKGATHTADLAEKAGIKTVRYTE
jgi:hypothetical protein